MPRQNKPQPTIEQCRSLYWARIEAYRATNEDKYSTWWQLRDAAQLVADAKADWEAAVLRSVAHGQPQAMRRRIAKSIVLDSLDERGYMREKPE